MKVISKGIAAPLKGLGLVKGPGRAPAPLRSVTRDDARDRIALEDELRRRRGGAADLMSGTSGAEAAGGSTGRSTLG